MATRADTAEETWEELEARLAEDAAAAEAGAYDHIFDPMIDDLFSQMPDGYIIVEGSFFRLDPDLPDHFYVESRVSPSAHSEQVAQRRRARPCRVRPRYPLWHADRVA